MLQPFIPLPSPKFIFKKNKSLVFRVRTNLFKLWTRNLLTTLFPSLDSDYGSLINKQINKRNICLACGNEEREESGGNFKYCTN